MRIAIYNRWLATLGGGERLMFDLAHVLVADGHTVDLLTHQPLTRAEIEQRLALPRERIALRAIPDSPGNMRLSAASAAYDLLINLSQGDLFPSQAARSLLVVHFPAPLEAYATAGAPPETWRAPAALRWIEGVYAPESDGRRWWAWTGAQATLELTRRWPGAARALLIRQAGLRPARVPPPRVQVWADGTLLGQREDEWSVWCLPLPRPVAPGAVCRVALHVTPWTLRAADLAPDDRERGLALQALALIANRLEARLVAGGAAQPLRALLPTERSLAQVQRALASYERVVANSRFTQHWIRRRWARDSTLLYPAVDVATWTPLPKQPLILAVGRFFADAHNKKHLELIAAFRAMCDAGLRDWELHLAGGCDLEQPAERAYLEAVRAAAQGYPIQVHVNLPRAELRRLYGVASIFWHAAGYGVDEEREPERCEHFGITTLEAMAAGCVPVVIARGGLRESVVHGASGLLWETLDELQAQTRRLIADEPLRRRLAQGARQRSQAFSLERFAAHVRALLT
ncbi:glycosyltransferase family 4 protein [Kallotenue papyrolyticum]|uniref:glycosyltransferase family 4 protein n=1 Tax=Kallotenue papyrolyticum TaxID=1325125 RepID=UPI0004785FCA|nr:glycosyltransferase family 4 protein [Kallotenue papyrolyticum]